MKWNQKNIDKLIKTLILDPNTNQILNYLEAGEKLGISEEAVRKETFWLRRKGLLPKYDRTQQFDEHYRPYSEKEIQAITNMFNHGCTNREIAERFNRTYVAIRHIQFQLLKQKKIKPVRERWTSLEEQILLDNIKCDKNHIVMNMNELIKLTHHSRESLTGKLYTLRKIGVLKKPLRQGRSEEGIKKHRKLLEAMFAK